MRTALLLLVSYIQQQLIVQSAAFAQEDGPGLLPSLLSAFALLQLLVAFRRVPIDVRALKTLLASVPDQQVRHMLRCALGKEKALRLWDEGLVMLTDKTKAG